MTFSIGIVQMEDEITIELTDHESKEEFQNWARAAGGEEVILAVDPYRAHEGDDYDDILAAMVLCISPDGIGDSLRHFAQKLFDLGRKFEQEK